MTSTPTPETPEVARCTPNWDGLAPEDTRAIPDPQQAVSGLATPKRGTVKMTALCRHCDQVLYRYPRWPWWHDMTGDSVCEP